MAETEFTENFNDLRELQRNLAHGVRAVQGGQVTGWLGKACRLPQCGRLQRRGGRGGCSPVGLGCARLHPTPSPVPRRIGYEEKGPAKGARRRGSVV